LRCRLRCWSFRRMRCRLRCRSFRCSQLRLFRSSLFRCGLSLQLLRSLSLVSTGALVASTGIIFSSSAAVVSASIWGILLSPRVHVDMGGRSVMFRRRAVPRRRCSFAGRRQTCPGRGSNRTHCQYIRARRRCRLLSMRRSTRTRSMFRN
jgi:hypothetical protein